MKPQTLENFSAALQAELGWRRKEMHHYKTTVEKSGHQAFVRGAVAVLYAHWEGFVKMSSESYLQFLVGQRRDYAELKSNFIALGLRSKFEAALTADSLSELTSLVDFIRNELASRARFSFSKVIDTRSNLSPSVLKSIVHGIGITYLPEFAIAEKPVLDRLLQLRNGIAHGEHQTVPLDEYLQLHGEIDKLLVAYCNEIDNSASQKRFLIHPSKPLTQQLPEGT